MFKHWHSPYLVIRRQSWHHYSSKWHWNAETEVISPLMTYTLKYHVKTTGFTYNFHRNPRNLMQNKMEKIQVSWISWQWLFIQWSSGLWHYAPPVGEIMNIWPQPLGFKPVGRGMGLVTSLTPMGKDMEMEPIWTNWNRKIALFRGTQCFSSKEGNGIVRKGGSFQGKNIIFVIYRRSLIVRTDCPFLGAPIPYTLL